MRKNPTGYVYVSATSRCIVAHKSETEISRALQSSDEKILVVRWMFSTAGLSSSAAPTVKCKIVMLLNVCTTVQYIRVYVRVSCTILQQTKNSSVATTPVSPEMRVQQIISNPQYAQQEIFHASSKSFGPKTRMDSTVVKARGACCAVCTPTRRTTRLSRNASFSKHCPEATSAAWLHRAKREAPDVCTRTRSFTSS